MCHDATYSGGTALCWQAIQEVASYLSYLYFGKQFVLLGKYAKFMELSSTDESRIFHDLICTKKDTAHLLHVCRSLEKRFF